ncbi:hypothetical protein E2562_030372 [Oryza meyeriana var. granulata]|uniref:Uncharacterized protein n=1 Tax=Oryza meyeriana var. granulata TaxID=110450 RepID=A0A6G1DPX9_9ORYZ|nr:hypothetical protein E2562_030372 [Oryza meyeriana var. granulata]
MYSIPCLITVVVEEEGVQGERLPRPSAPDLAPPRESTNRSRYGGLLFYGRLSSSTQRGRSVVSAPGAGES